MNIQLRDYMRLYKSESFFLGTVFCIAAILFSSCAKPAGESDENYNSLFSVTPKVLKAGVSGGEFAIDYAISGPMEGGVAQVTAGSPWIHVRSVYNSEFTCTVDANDSGRDRTGKISLRCSGTKPLDLMVIQGTGGGDSPIYRNFRIEVSDVTTSTCRVQVTPVDAGKTYIWTPVRVADYEKETPEKLIKACIEQAESLAVTAGTTPDKFLSSGALDTQKLEASMRPQLFDRTDYYLAVFDISYDKSTKKFSYSGDIDLLRFRTLSAPASDMKFEIRYDNGTLIIQPDKADETYVFNYVTKEAWESVDPDYAAQYYILYASKKGSLEVCQNLLRKDLTQDTEMERGTEYVAFAVGYHVSETDGGLTTEVNYIEFTY